MLAFPQMTQLRSAIWPPQLTAGQPWNGGVLKLLLAIVQFTATALPPFTLKAPLFPMKRQFAKLAVAEAPLTKTAPPPSPGASLRTKSHEMIWLGVPARNKPPPPAPVVLWMN